ncbi:PTS system N-acetylglucosamine-specific IIC component [Spiroplasma sabaudiense Ar-1343]|uniref:PTS system N-acetylglucosamine-specific IIC component n=1 Tax=Spiroplasma sabaudiense Ar-1343 TaxID=1276257 RepID=W6A9Z2_9MOLU|nr:PTS transporter subunit EIIC [Spiroplasma sabaudiense]AHI53867.1 PTS system N-acetylglucosamine-specific IIC component [Spiroplasma sabaudiense Ar-1343]
MSKTDIIKSDTLIADEAKVSSKKISKKLSKTNSSQSGWNKFLSMLQELGKSLQFPIAVLPFAAILNRFGALGIQFTTDAAGEITNQAGYWISFFFQAPGGVVFDNLPLLFAIGVAFGLAKDHRGEVALISTVFYLIIVALTGKEGSLPEAIYGTLLPFKTADGKELFSSLFYVPVYEEGVIVGGAYVLSVGVLGGIVSGCFSAYLYNRLKEIQLPQALSFFSGRRFVPMVAMVVAMGVAFGFAVVWPWIQFVLMKFGNLVANPENPAVAVPGTAVFAALNRFLLPFGLHQILNTFFWFQLPINGFVIDPITGNAGTVEKWVSGDINAFAQGIEGSGLFQGGWFPIMMGGMPMAAVAMIMAAPKAKRQQVAGFLGGVAAVSFISGITEPIEFSFVFIAPVLFGIHVGLSAVFFAVSTAMRIQLGFGFSAGLIDYVVSFAQSWGFSQHNTGAFKVLANPLMTLVLTVGAGAAYYFIFYGVIVKMNIQTPGREIEVDGAAPVAIVKTEKTKGKKDFTAKAQAIIDALGADNIEIVDNCTTRLRLTLKDANDGNINDAAIKAAGAFGIKRLGDKSMQIVLGPDVQQVSSKMKELLGKQ